MATDRNRFCICVGREFGSGGKRTAEILASVFGIKVYDSELLEEAARASGFKSELFERTDEHSRFRWLFGVSARHQNSRIGEGPMTPESLFRYQCDVIRDIYERESCVFVGRCADYVLRDEPGMVSVFISADMDDRVERIMEKRSLGRRQAESLIEQTDRKRSQYYGYYTFRTWGAASSYDLCVNSSRLGIERTAGTVERYVRDVLAFRGISAEGR